MGRRGQKKSIVNLRTFTEFCSFNHVEPARSMPRKKVDNRIRTLVENGLTTRQRTMFVIVGDKARDQVG